jgi:hypothetical protein
MRLIAAQINSFDRNGIANSVARVIALSMLALPFCSPALAQYATGSPGSTATGVGSIAIGGGAGADATALQKDAVAIGDKALSTQEYDLALGFRSTADGKNVSVVNGAGESVPLRGTALSIGYYANAQQYGAVAIGNSASVFGRRSISVGSSRVGDTGKESNESIAIGYDAQAGLAIPSSSNVHNSIAIGTSARSVFDGISIGSGSNTFGDHSISIGIAAKSGVSDGSVESEAPSAVTIGNGAKGYGPSAIAIGVGSESGELKYLDNTKSPAALVPAKGSSVAIGDKAKAKEYGVSLGSLSNAVKLQSLALGANANTSQGQARDVALGANSMTEPLISTPEIYIIEKGNPKGYPVAGGAPNSTVSVGNGGMNGTRTITNVAAGRVSGVSTDAINGSQLDVVIKRLEQLMQAFDAYVAAHP